MKKVIKRFLLTVLGSSFLYLFLLIYPNFLFGNKYEYKNFKVFSDEKISEEIAPILDQVQERISKSELYEEKDKFRIYLCNKKWRFSFFVRNPKAGGVVNFLISPNVFIRESVIEENRIVPPGTWMYEVNERDLVYFLSHELTHSLERKISPFLVANKAGYILEGYADYIGKKPHFDFETYKQAYINQDPKMLPDSPLYNRYHLYTAYLMDVKGYSFKQILEEELPLSILNELR